MAITLDPILQTAQDGCSHRPVIEILTTPLTTDLPLEGHQLTGLTEESQPSAIVMASGKLVVAYVKTGRIYLMISDNDRVEWMAPVVAAGTLLGVSVDVSITELADGNIGVLCRTATGFFCIVCSPFGVVVNAGARIGYSTSYTLGNLSVLRLANNTYLMAQTAKNTDDEWVILTRTSSDFLTWSAETAVTVSGFATSQTLANPHLMQLDTGAVWMFFDAVEASAATNVYQMASADNGATWGAPVALTTNTEITEKAQQPVAVQKTANRVDVAWVDSSAVITQERTELALDGKVIVDHMHFDPATRKLYLLNIFPSTGNKYLDNVIRVDVDTWAVDKIWDTDSVPAIPYIFGQYHVWYHVHYATPGSRIGWALTSNKNALQAAVLDGDADTITHYAFADWAEHGVTQNVAWEPIKKESYLAQINLSLKSTFLDADNDRFYVLFHDNSHLNANCLQLGYIDLTDPGPEYTFRDIVASTNFLWPGYSQLGDHRFKVYADDDLIIVDHAAPSNWGGGLLILNLSSGATYKLYNYAGYEQFPICGVNYFELDGESVYCSFVYTATEPEKLKRGLLEINLLTDQMVYHIPPFADDTEYGITSITKIADHELLITSNKYGSSIFNTLTKGWIHYSAAEMPGYNDSQWCGAYDPVQEMVFTGNDKLYGFLRSGPVKQIMTRSIAPSDLATIISDQMLVRGFREDSPALALPPDDINFYAFWRRSNVDLDEWVSWGMESSAKYIEDYLTDAGLSIRRSIDGSPHELTMQLSHGHLFDPHNLASLWHIYLKKGRQITVWLGEIVSDVPYIQLMGRFVVTAMRMKYQRGAYPTIEITAKDKRVFLEHNIVPVTEYYSMLPGAAASDLIQRYTQIEAGDINFPVMENGINLETQWIDTPLGEIIPQICDRFGYYPTVTTEGVLTARKISRDNAVNHAYDDTTQIVDFSPDDSFSDFVNRITVTGEERNHIEVMFDEERVGNLNGTIGWWGYKKTFDVYYSDDRSRRCRHPRLHVLESATCIGFKLMGGVSEKIKSSDEYHCVVEVKAPSLVIPLIIAIAGYVAATQIPDKVITFGVIASGGFTISVGRLAEGVFMLIIMMILSSIGNFQYEIYARPLGYVRRSIESTANDEEFQAEIGEVIEERQEGWCCYSVPDCRIVAEFELMLAQLQRNRVTFNKISHLMDEEGDTIRIPHPHTGWSVKFFVTDLTRTWKPGGDCIDQVEGWVL